MYCKLFVFVSYLFLEIKQCVLSPPSVSKPPQVVSPTNSHSQRLYGLAPVAKYFTKNQDGGSLSPFLAMIHDNVMMDMW